MILHWRQGLLLALVLVHLLFRFKGAYGGNPQQANDVTPCDTGDEDWMTSSNDCIYVGKDSKSWDASRKTCKSYRSDLASFTTGDHDPNLLSWLNRASPYWVGYRYGPSDSGWLNGNPGQYGSRFLTASSRGQKRCGSVLVGGNGTHTFLEWRLYNCTVPYRFLCMIGKKEQDAITLDPAAQRTAETGMSSSETQQRQSEQQEQLRQTRLRGIRRCAGQHAFMLSRISFRATVATYAMHSNKNTFRVTNHDTTRQDFVKTRSLPGFRGVDMKGVSLAKRVRLRLGRNISSSLISMLSNSQADNGKSLGHTLDSVAAVSKLSSLEPNSSTAHRKTNASIEKINGVGRTISFSRYRGRHTESAARRLEHAQRRFQTDLSTDITLAAEAVHDLIYDEDTVRKQKQKTRIDIGTRSEQLRPAQTSDTQTTTVRPVLPSGRSSSYKEQRGKRRDPSKRVSWSSRIVYEQKMGEMPLLHVTQLPGTERPVRRVQTFQHPFHRRRRRHRSPSRHSHSHEVDNHEPFVRRHHCCWITTPDGGVVISSESHCRVIIRNPRHMKDYTCTLSTSPSPLSTTTSSTQSANHHPDTAGHGHNPFSTAHTTSHYSDMSSDQAFSTASPTYTQHFVPDAQQTASAVYTASAAQTSAGSALLEDMTKAYGNESPHIDDNWLQVSSAQRFSSALTRSPTVTHFSLLAPYLTMTVTDVSAAGTSKEPDTSSSEPETSSMMTSEEPNTSQITSSVPAVVEVTTTASAPWDQLKIASTAASATQYTTLGVSPDTPADVTMDLPGSFGLQTTDDMIQMATTDTGVGKPMGADVTLEKFLVISAKTTLREVTDFIRSPECQMAAKCISQVLLHPDLPAHVKVDLLNSDIIPCPLCDLDLASDADNTTLTADRWKHSIEYFFRVLNRYLGDSHIYSRLPQHKLQSLEPVLHAMDNFLTTMMDEFHTQSNMQRAFSHLEFQIKNVSGGKEVREFHYQDQQALCYVSHVDFSHHSGSQRTHSKAVLVSVVMNVPNHHAVLKTGGDSEEGVIGSPVLLFSGYVHGQPHSLSHSFQLKRLIKDDKQGVLYRPHCAFLEDNSRMWSTYGCETDLNSTHTHDDEVDGSKDDNDASGMVQCRCNHTSNFAILMQIIPFKVSGVHQVALSIITYIGCSITLITQIMAITVFTCIGSLNCERVCVHRNLCLAIVGAQITFLAGTEAVEHRLVCSVVAVLLHYCYTAVFVWMLVEGLHLYSKVVRVFGTERSRMTYYVCFGWGLPVILVTISAAADWEGYGTPTSCWLSIERNTIWSFVGPALAIIIVNLVILAAVVKIVMASAKLDRHGEFDHIRAGVKAALLLLPLLGLTWVFGLAAVNKDLIIFQYLFALFNTLQGFFIFLFHCVFNTEVRQALRRLQEKRSLQRGDLSSLAGFSSSPSTSPIPTVQTPDPKKALGRGDSPTGVSAPYKVNRVVPARYTSTTNIVSRTVPSNTSSFNYARDRRAGNPQPGSRRKTEEKSLMFI